VAKPLSNGEMDVKVLLIFGQILCGNKLTYSSHRSRLQNI
jgi:hypothetical protein